MYWNRGALKSATAETSFWCISKPLSNVKKLLLKQTTTTWAICGKCQQKTNTNRLKYFLKSYSLFRAATVDFRQPYHQVLFFNNKAVKVSRVDRDMSKSSSSQLIQSDPIIRVYKLPLIIFCQASLYLSMQTFEIQQSSL